MKRLLKYFLVILGLTTVSGCGCSNHSRSNMEKTLVIFKPDAMKQHKVGAILQRFEDAGLNIAGIKMMQLDEPILKEHYAHLADKPFFGNIVEFMSSTPVVIVILEGNDVVARVREMTGPTDSTIAPKGTIRGDFGKDKSENMIHASDSKESAEAEIARFFKPLEVF